MICHPERPVVGGMQLHSTNHFCHCHQPKMSIIPAAEWAIPKLAKEHATLLEKAKKAYLGDYDDKWEGMETEIIELVNYLKRSIESSLNI